METCRSTSLPGSVTRNCHQYVQQFLPSLNQFDTAAWFALADHAIIHGDGRVTIAFKDATTL